ncbi:maleylpyruvate isomerase family mycothiol-dependent enzyme [Actinotalea caeni]|uniref:maleylpyruvate isomerase family mycothiol-dependent enzyme n=1 Tax=Actinotalea caeni TaxID=1348467 RepID=UPI0012E20228|nr:maleylpyruvate isomerase family mycothiol-dependent enzyme [Actinotalea caeni]
MTESTQGGLDHLDHLDHLAALADRQDAFLRTVEVADPTVRVPWCGRWRVSNLVVHLARVHHWAAAQARRRRETPLGRGPFDLPVLYAECAAELRATLAELDPDARAWTLLDDGVPREQQRGTVRFWHRRQALETLVHLWDLRTALGEPYEPGPEAWLDCLDEVATVMHPRQVRLGRVAAPPVRVTAVPDETGAEVPFLAADDATGSCVLAGPARDLALLVWGRADLDSPALRVTGDPDSLATVLSAGLTP